MYLGGKNSLNKYSEEETKMKQYTERQIEKMGKVQAYSLLFKAGAFTEKQIDGYMKNHGELFAQLTLYSYLDTKGLIIHE
jgi:hypothetical protein